MVSDAASLAVMIEGIGSRSQRWMQIKREEFALLESAHRGTNKNMPRCIQKQASRLNYAVSSLSNSPVSSNQFSSGGDDMKRGAKPAATRVASTKNPGPNAPGAAKVSSSSGSSNSNESRQNQNSSSSGFHDYHAKPLPDPKLNDSEQDESPSESNDSSNGDTKRISTDSSSREDSPGAVAGPRAAKKRKVDHGQGSISGSSSLPPKISQKGGIGHVVRLEQMPAATIPDNGNGRLSMAPAVALPPFAGIGKKRSSSNTARVAPIVAAAVVVNNNRNPSVVGTGNNLSFSNNTTGLGDRHQPAVVSTDAGADTSSGASSGDSKIPQLRAQYHLNEDDMILMEDTLMCPFVFRSHNAVLCGALSECVMPGMLRAHFSTNFKVLRWCMMPWALCSSWNVPAAVTGHLKLFRGVSKWQQQHALRQGRPRLY